MLTDKSTNNSLCPRFIMLPLNKKKVEFRNHLKKRGKAERLYELQK